MLDFQGMYMIRSQKKIWPRLEAGVSTQIWSNMLGSSQNPAIFLLMIPTPIFFWWTFLAPGRDEQSRKNHPPFSKVLTSWRTRFLSSRDFKETREKVKGKQTYRVNEGFDSGKTNEHIKQIRCKTLHLGFPTSCFWKSIFWHVHSGIPEDGLGRKTINQLNM